MRLFTTQSPTVWNRARRIGYLSGGDPRHGPYKLGDERWLHGYKWMRSQMEMRIPDFSGDYPVWAWLRRPDLRKPGHGRPKDRELLLVVEVPKSRVLLSDFQDWHSALNDSYLPIDYLHWSHSMTVPRKLKELSWELMIRSNESRLSPKSRRELQACIDRVYLDEVKQVHPFTAR